MQQQQPAATIIMRRSLHDKLGGGLPRALSEAFAHARVVAASDDLPADIIFPAGTGVLMVQPPRVGEWVLDVPRAQRIASTFKHPVICVVPELLNRAVLELLDAQLLERFTVLPFGCAEGLALSMAEVGHRAPSSRPTGSRHWQRTLAAHWQH
jgi:hypothetical protein